MQKLTITEREAGQRLDRYLRKYMSLAPGSFIYKMLRKKNIKLNGKKAEGGERLKTGDQVSLFLADDTIADFRADGRQLNGLLEERRGGSLWMAGRTVSQQNGGCQQNGSSRQDGGCQQNGRSRQFTLDILYEDEDILIVNKPQGVLSQRAQKQDVSMVEYISAYLDGQAVAQDTFRPGICNRLDRNTTGVLVAGKSVRGLQWMNALFRERTLRKYYLCIVHGKLSESRRMSGYLVKDSRKNMVQIVEQPVAGADRILTEYEPLQHGTYGDGVYTLLRVQLMTGKSHQIRAHLASIGHPLAGDAKYGSKAVNQALARRFHLNCQLLHAWELYLPERAPGFPQKYWGKCFSAPIPRQFRQLMEGMGMECVQEETISEWKQAAQEYGNRKQFDNREVQ